MLCVLRVLRVLVLIDVLIVRPIAVLIAVLIDSVTAVQFAQ
ncbi:hypothetical protein [Streptomyces globisporus]|nr:hypothetical protein [Streptomyces globisporus]